MKIPILYEDDFLLVLDKPAGVHTSDLPHPEEPTYSAAQFLRSYLKTTEKISEKWEDAGLIHRLDRDTSGVLLAAKSESTWLALRTLLGQGAIKKEYLLLVEGEFPATLTVRSYIGSPNRGAAKMRNFPERPKKKDRALPAHTEFLRSWYNSEREVSLVKAIAPSARRHQIRVHAASEGFPLVGDSLYGSTRSLSELGEEGLSRAFYLHASSITFPHPHLTGLITVQSPSTLGLTSDSSRHQK